MRSKLLAVMLAGAFLSSCSYPLTQMSVSSKSITKPHTVLGRVEASDWSWYAFSDVSKANALAELNEKAKTMGADEVVDVKVKNNCWWAWIIIFPTCQSDAVGTAIKYQ
jgi:hypothetical protein